jgi:hypothetical protein
MLWNFEIPVFKHQYPFLAASLVLFLSSAIAVALLLNLHTDALFLGPGLGMEASTKPFFDFVNYLNNIHEGLGFVLVGTAIISACSVASLSCLGYFRYKNTFGEHYPLRELLTFPGIATLERLLFSLAIILLGIGAWLTGFDFESGFKLINHWAVQTNDWINARVPTLVKLPYVAAFFVSYGIAGFVHYGLHRMSHERRFFWLLFHRFHHMPTIMFPAGVPPVFFSVPLFIFVVIPYHLAFGMLTKLFCDQPLYFALIIYKLIYYIPDNWAHNTAMFRSGRKNPVVMISSFLFSNGIFHYIHHSSVRYNGKSTNMVNLGGSFLHLPDLIFGTFRWVPKTLPPVGLTDQPNLYYNPVRLSLSGIAQIFYELWHNRSLKAWLGILFGSVDYTPSNSKDFALLTTH